MATSAGSKVKHVRAPSSVAVPVADGQVLVNPDTASISVDAGESRVRITDILKVDSWPLAPIAGKVYVLSSGGARYYHAGGYAEMSGSGGPGIELVEGSQGANVNSWTGVTEDASLEDGKLLIYKVPSTPNNSVSLSLTLSGGSGSPVSVPVYQSDGTQLKSQYSSGDRVLLVYNSAQTRWYDASPFHDKNDNALFLLDGSVVLGEAISGDQHFLGYSPSASGYVRLVSGATYSPHERLVFAWCGSKSSGATVNAYAAYAATRLSKSILGTSVSIPKGKPVYLKGTMGSGGLVTLSQDVVATELPSTADGSVYQYIGIGSDTGKFYFLPSPVLLEYRDGRVQPCVTAPSGGGGGSEPSGGGGDTMLDAIIFGG